MRAHTPVELEAKLKACRAAIKARREAEGRARYHWRCEGIWPASTAFLDVVGQFPEKTDPVIFEHDSKPAARQLRLNLVDRYNSCPWRIFVTLDSGEIAVCTCLVPPYSSSSLSHLAVEAARVGLAELGKRPRCRQWWQE